jgi:hypothetical protein
LHDIIQERVKKKERTREGGGLLVKEGKGRNKKWVDFKPKSDRSVIRKTSLPNTKRGKSDLIIQVSLIALFG